MLRGGENAYWKANINMKEQEIFNGRGNPQSMACERLGHGNSGGKEHLQIFVLEEEG